MAVKEEITLREQQELEQEVADISVRLEEILEQQRVAREFGDLSENTEYEVATKEAKKLQKDREKILEKLSNCVIVEPDGIIQITIGCTVGITRLDTEGNSISEERQLRLASKGNSVQKGTLGVNSPLGRAIMNGTDGEYTIQTVSGGVRYYVRKITQGQ